MKNQRKRLLALVAMVLACIMVLPVFGGCSKEEEAPTTTAEEAFKEETDGAPAVSTQAPVATKSNPNAESLQSTPNKGGNTKVTSGTTSVKSKYSEEQEALLNGTTLNTATPQERRDYAEAYMRAMQTNLFILQDRPDTQVSTSSGEKTYYLHDYADEAAWKKAYGTAALKTPDNYDYKVGMEKTYSFEFRSGVTYRGLPYSRGVQGLEAFNLFVKEKTAEGVSVMDTRLDTYYLYGGPGVIGNTPGGALAYAWNSVSYTTYTSETTSTMVPQNGYCFVEGLKLPEMTEEELKALQNPTIPGPNGEKNVGSVILQKLSKTIQDASLDNDTDDIVKYNGEQGMYAAYANLLKADGVIRNDGTNPDDCKMIVTVTVVKNPDGTINGDESFVTVLAQTSYLKDLVDEEGNPVLDANGNQIRTFSEVDAKYTFKQLFEGNFIPVTVPELLYESEDDGGASVRDPNEAYAARKTASYLYTGVLGASRRVLWLNAVLTDEAGNEVFNNICFAERGDIKTYAKGSTTEPGRYIFDMSKLDDSQEKVVSLGTDVVAGSSLKAGTYHYKITARMITGEELVAREFDFTVAAK